MVPANWGGGSEGRGGQRGQGVSGQGDQGDWRRRGGRGVWTLVLGGHISKRVYSGGARPRSGNTKLKRRPIIHCP